MLLGEQKTISFAQLKDSGIFKIMYRQNYPIVSLALTYSTPYFCLMTHFSHLLLLSNCSSSLSDYMLREVKNPVCLTYLCNYYTNESVWQWAGTLYYFINDSLTKEVTDISCGPISRINYNANFGSKRGRTFSNSQNHLKLEVGAEAFK